MVDKTWVGYIRANGFAGIHNEIFMIYTVECSASVTKKIVRLADNSETEVVSFSGYTNNEYAVRLLISLIRHPDIDGVLAVSLGCECVQPQ